MAKDGIVSGHVNISDNLRLHGMYAYGLELFWSLALSVQSAGGTLSSCVRSR